MKLSYATLDGFKRFSDLKVGEIPQAAKLVILTGPNGCGKSSLFDAFREWFGRTGTGFGNQDIEYHRKKFLRARNTVTDGVVYEENTSHTVTLEFHGQVPTTQPETRKMFYFRTAYRNDPDFVSSNLQRIGSPIDENRIQRMIDQDITVQINYQRLVTDSIQELYDPRNENNLVKDLRDRLIKEIQGSMGRVFEDLILSSIGKPLENGTFFFDKGESKMFPYKNLSGGEKAVFDLLLDLIVKREHFNNTIYCIDEPELHINTRIQSSLMKELYGLIPDNCQMWMATHSIGMMRQARDLYNDTPEAVVFLDFDGRNFDSEVKISPTKINRAFWQSTLNIALDDMSNLIIPKQVVICEGKPAGTDGSGNQEFDAQCFRKIFQDDLPDTDFLSAGAALEVENDRLAFVKAIQSLAQGVEILRTIDRDDRSEQEIEDLKTKGIRVLSKRHIESYLLDSEILVSLLLKHNKGDQIFRLLDEKKIALENSQRRGKPHDDIKSAGGEIFNSVKAILNVSGLGSNKNVFCKDIMAPLITPDTTVYKQLKEDIFGGTQN